MNLFQKKHDWILGGFEFLHADDVTADPGTGGATFRTDQLAGGQHVPFTKIMSGTADDDAVIPGDATNGLFVQVKASALPTGAATAAAQTTGNTSLATLAGAVSGTEMQVDVLSSALPTGAATAANQSTGNTSLATLAGAVSGTEMQVDVVSSALPSGAATAAKQPALGTAGTASADVITVQGVASMTAIQVADNGGSITIDAASLPLPTGASTAAKQPALGTAGSASADVITVQGVASMTPLQIADNGGSLTVDGSVSLAAALPAGTNNIGDVDILSIAAGDNNIGNVDIVTMPNVTLAAGTNTNEVVGDVAHDAAVGGNPVLIAARANANEPSAVSADGDATHLWADLLGRLVVQIGHPNPEAPVSINATASGESDVIAAPGAGSLHICKGSIHNRDASNVVVSLLDGASGTVRFRAELAAEGGAVGFSFGSRGWKLTATTKLVVNLGGAGSVDVNITEYYIAA
jgi:hypothetical protein